MFHRYTKRIQRVVVCDQIDLAGAGDESALCERGNRGPARPELAAGVAVAAGLSVAAWARWRLDVTDPAAWVTRVHG